jgi:hypothetical protein
MIIYMATKCLDLERATHFAHLLRQTLTRPK